MKPDPYPIAISQTPSQRRLSSGRPWFARFVVANLPTVMVVLVATQICCGNDPIPLPAHFGSSGSIPPASGDEKKAIRLTHDGRLKHDPVFINDGKTLVYSSLEKFNQVCLMKLDRTDINAKPERFHPEATTSELMVTFAKNAKTYSYLRNNGNLHFEIVIEIKSSGARRSYNPGGGFAGVRNISFAPDGSNVLFAFPNQNGPQQIHSLNQDGETVALLTDSNGINIAPRYSPDGKRIAFASSRDGDFDIFVMNRDGSGPKNLTGTRGMETHPAWSPDGKRIAFTRLHKGNYDLFVMDADGSNVQRITFDDEVDDYACWHPNGKSIIWVAERKGKRDLYQIAAPKD